MNGISQAQFEVQVAEARRFWGEILDAAEGRHGLPGGLIYAVGSRETNLDARYTKGATGDFGHGHGLFQLDNRSHHIPSGFDTNVGLQAEIAAGMLADLYRRAGSWHPALNMYNSGRPSDGSTTGHDYGPDVLDRFAHLHGHAVTPLPAVSVAAAHLGVHPLLRRGAKGPVVARWQAVVGCTADGDFGPNTESATKAWQAKHGLTADGIVGPLSWAKSGA